LYVPVAAVAEAITAIETVSLMAVSAGANGIVTPLGRPDEPMLQSMLPHDGSMPTPS
jgi:hypothetical protein